MGLANKLEEMRKEGGDAWLSIWNADATKVSLCVCVCVCTMYVFVYAYFVSEECTHTCTNVQSCIVLCTCTCIICTH